MIVDLRKKCEKYIEGKACDSNQTITTSEAYLIIALLESRCELEREIMFLEEKVLQYETEIAVFNNLLKDNAYLET